MSPRIRHRNELTDKDWENAVEGLDKVLSTILKASKNWNIGSGPGSERERRVRRTERKKAFRQSLSDYRTPQNWLRLISFLQLFYTANEN